MHCLKPIQNKLSMEVLHIRWTQEEIIADRLVPSELRKLVSKEGQPIPQEPSQLKAYAISTTISEAIQKYIRVFDPDLLAHPNRWPQLLNFTQLAFGPQGLPHLQILALGDFSVAGRADPEKCSEDILSWFPERKDHTF